MSATWPNFLQFFRIRRTMYLVYVAQKFRYEDFEAQNSLNVGSGSQPGLSIPPWASRTMMIRRPPFWQTGNSERKIHRTRNDLKIVSIIVIASLLWNPRSRHLIFSPFRKTTSRKKKKNKTKREGKHRWMDPFRQTGSHLLFGWSEEQGFIFDEKKGRNFPWLMRNAVVWMQRRDGENCSQDKTL